MKRLLPIFIVFCLVGCVSPPNGESDERTVSTRELVRRLEGKLQGRPDDVPLLLRLSEATLQLVRETADTSLYEDVLSIADRIDAIEPDTPESAFLRATVAAGRHNFAEALEFSNRAIERRPSTALFHGIKVDSLIELGRYEEAEKALQAMVNLKPDFASYSRISYLRELHGDRQGAIEAMAMAIRAGAAFPENSSWGEVQLGNLTRGRNLDEAEHHYERALATAPDFPPALRGLGVVAFARGDTGRARQFFLQAFEALPIAEHATDLADLALVAGDEGTAARYSRAAIAAYLAIEKTGVNVDSELARFLADHDMDLPEALTRARRAYGARPNLHGADTLAWALYKNREYEEAQQYSKEAMGLGTLDPLLFFHAGMIAKALGQSAQARQQLQRVFEIDPSFSVLYVQSAAKALEDL